MANEQPFAGERFTVSGEISGTDGVRPVVLESFDEVWTPVAKGETSTDGAYEFSASTKERSARYRV